VCRYIIKIIHLDLPKFTKRTTEGVVNSKIVTTRFFHSANVILRSCYFSKNSTFLYGLPILHQPTPNTRSAQIGRILTAVQRVSLSSKQRKNFDIYKREWALQTIKHENVTQVQSTKATGIIVYYTRPHNNRVRSTSKCFTSKQFRVRGGQDAYTNFTNIVRRR